jgi:hypothetical protein
VLPRYADSRDRKGFTSSCIERADTYPAVLAQLQYEERVQPEKVIDSANAKLFGFQ